MENFMPPPNPNATPEELQAWRNMMDTMVTFIRASTNLMNTINQRIGAGAVLQQVCESECVMCVEEKPAAKCGVCGPQGAPPPPQGDAGDEVVAADEDKAEDDNPEEAPPEAAEEPAEAAAQPADQCVCAVVRARKQGDRPGGEDDGLTDLCACPPTEGEKQVMLDEMARKLQTARQEIEALQREMDKLQRMSASKRNSARIYKEIMKGSDDQARLDRIRARLFQGNSNYSDVLNSSGQPPNISQRFPLNNGGCMGCGANESEAQQISRIWSPSPIRPPPGLNTTAQSYPQQQQICRRVDFQSLQGSASSRQTRNFSGQPPPDFEAYGPTLSPINSTMNNTRNQPSPGDFRSLCSGMSGYTTRCATRGADSSRSDFDESVYMQPPGSSSCRR